MLKKSILGIIIFMFSIILLLFLSFSMTWFDGHQNGVIVMNEKVSIPFAVAEDKKELLLYFGYVGCDTICMPALGEIARLYEDLPNKKEYQVYFINLLKEGGGANDFAQFFHKDFIGIDLLDAKGLQETLHVYHSDSLQGDGALSHTGFLYRLQRSKDLFILKSIYVQRPFDIDIILTDRQNNP